MIQIAIVVVMHNEKVNRRNLAIAAAVAVIMLFGTLISITAATTDSAFARKYGRHDANDVNQAASVRILTII